MVRISSPGASNFRIPQLHASSSSTIRNMKLSRSVVDLSYKVPIQISAADCLSSGSNANIATAINRGYDSSRTFDDNVSFVRKSSRGVFDLVSISLAGLPSSIIVKKDFNIKPGLFQVVHAGEIKEGLIEFSTAFEGLQAQLTRETRPPVEHISARQHTEGPASFKGIATNTGVEIGRALVVSSQLSFSNFPDEDLIAEATAKRISAEDVVIEHKEKFENAISEWMRLQSMSKEKLTPNQRQDIDKFVMVVKDIAPMILQKMEADVVCASTASKTTLDLMFGNQLRSDNAGQRDFARRQMEDIEKTLCEVLAIKKGRHVNIENEVNSCDFDEKIILVLHDLSPTSDFYSTDRVCAVVREHGSTTDHPSLKADEYEIVSIVHAKGAVNSIRTGDMVIVDSSQNNPVLVNPGIQRIEEAKARQVLIKKVRKIAQKLRGIELLNPITNMPVAFCRNADNPDMLRNAVERQKADGSGLIRSEYFFMRDDRGDKRAEEPSAQDQIRFYNELQAAGLGRPVKLRTIDVAAKVAGMETVVKDKMLPYFDITVGTPKEADGLALCLNQTKPLYWCFRNQLSAILQSEMGQVMFPQVRSAAEMNNVFNIIDGISQSLEKQGKKANKDISFGMMVENTQVLSDLDEILRSGKVKFLSIGTNDLTMDISGISRYAESEQTFYEQQFGKGVREALETVKQIADRNCVPVGICGNVVNDWRGLLMLLSMGYSEFSFSNAEKADISRKIVDGVTQPGLEMLRGNIDSTITPHQTMHTIENFTDNMLKKGRWGFSDIWDYLQSVFVSYSQ